MTELVEFTDAADAGWRSVPPACSTTSTWPACSPPPTCTSRRGRAGWRGRETSGCCSPSRWPPARCATAPSASTSRPWPTWPPTSAGPTRTAGPSGVAASPLAAAGVVRLDQGLLYLDRYWRQEGELCTDLQARLARPAPVVDAAALEAGLLRVFAGDTYDEQRAASRRAAGQWTTVLTGGPGHRQDHHRRRAAGAAGRAAAARRAAAAADRAERPDRQGLRPAAAGGRDRHPGPGAGRPGPARPPVAPSPCTGCWAPGATTAPGSATTAATGCRTTWSSSTSRRWSR